MKNPTMVYQSPGSMGVDRATGKGYQYKTVDAGEEGAVEEALAAGWYGSPKEAIAAVNNVPVLIPLDAPPTRAEMEQKAHELKIDFDDSTEDELLMMLIDEALTNPMKGDFL